MTPAPNNFHCTMRRGGVKQWGNQTTKNQNHMKKIIGSIIAIASLAFSLNAQVNPPPLTPTASGGVVLINPFPAPPAAPISSVLSNAPTSPGTFFGTVQSYFTSFNPSLEQTFHKTNEWDIWAGADNVQGSGMTASLGVSYNVWKFVSLESVTRNGSVAGTIVGQQFQLGLNKVVHDVKVTGFVGGGYDFNQKESYGILGARFIKALTENTFAGLSIEEHIGGSKIGNTPTVSILTGFNF